jgi:hypothetical protein
MVESGKWRDFWDYMVQRCDRMLRPHEFTAWLSCYGCPEQIGERMKMAAEFIEERSANDKDSY